MLTLLLGLFALPASAEAPLVLETTEDMGVEGLVAADADATSFRLATKPAHGVAKVDALTGKLSYTPARDTHGEDAFVVEFSQGKRTVKVPVSIRVAPVNDAPAGRPLTLSTKEDVAVRGTAVATDVDGDVLSFKPGKLPAHGTMTIDERSGALTYQPAPDTSGPDAFTVEVSDGGLSTTIEVLVAVQALNDAPIAAAASFSGDEDTLISGQVTASDSEGDTLTYRLLRPPEHGTARVESATGEVNYQPAPDFNGADALSVEVSAGRLSAISEVSLTVTPVNDAPVAMPATFSLDEDAPIDGRVVATDVDGTALTYKIAQHPAHGAVTIDVHTGALRFVPQPDFNGDDLCTVEVSDGTLKTIAPVKLEVKAVNDAPALEPLALTTAEDSVVSGKLVARDADSTLSFAVVTAPAHGAARVEPKTGVVSWQPAGDFNGADAFTVEVSDGSLTARAEVKVLVSAVDDAPVLAPVTIAVEEDGRLEQLLAATDVDGQALTYRLARGPTHGVASVDAATGKLSYQPTHDFNGSDAVMVEVTDGKLKVSAVITLSVQPMNDAPVAAPIALSTREDTACRGAVVATDVDRDALRFRVAQAPARGEASVDPVSGQVSYVPAPDSHGADSFIIEVSDGAQAVTSVVSVAVEAVDDPPVVHAAAFEVREDTMGEGTLAFTEADGERVTFRLLSTPRLGAAVLLDAASGTWRFTPGADLNGDDALEYEVSDGKTAVVGTVKIHVVPVNDAPAVARLAISTREDEPVEGQLVGTDVDGDVFTYRLLAPAGGNLKVEASTGRIRFVPAKDAHGQLQFEVVATDGSFTSAPATVLVTVQPQNDAPVARDGVRSLNEDEVTVGTLEARDVDGDALVYRVVKAPLHGSLEMIDASVGMYEYTPAANYGGEDAFTFSVTDPSMSTSTATVRLTIKEVNDPPVAVTEQITAPYRGMISGQLKGYDRESRHVTFRLLEQPSNGELKLIDPRTGEFTFSTEGRGTRESSAKFEVDDGSLVSQPAELTIQIRGM